MGSERGPLSQHCCPESPATLALQQKQLIRGERSVQMFPVGTLELPLPCGMSRIPTKSGVFHYDSAAITDDEIDDAVASERENDILGLGPYSKHDIANLAKSFHDLVCVVERSPEGIELRCALGTYETAPDQMKYMAARKSPGSVVRQEPWEDILLARFNNG